jgi:endonuclease-3
MNKRAVFIMRTLERLFPKVSPPLSHTTPYTLLVAVVLSARNTDKKVNEVTPALFKKADTPEKMARLTPEQVRKFIRQIGLAPTKAKNIVALSKILVKKFGGKVPRTFQDLESLPGVGHKTASVVMAQAFGHPAFPVDTHIFRCAHRWGLSSGKTVEKVEEDLKKLFPKEKWIPLHLQIIYFARAYCPALRHNKEKCPICSKL